MLVAATFRRLLLQAWLGFSVFWGVAMTFFNFGRYKGIPLTDVPEWYLSWALLNVTTLFPWQIEEINKILGINQDDSFENFQQEVERKIEIWYRQQSLKYHPDLGGNASLMASLNDLRSSLKSLFSREDF